MLYSWHIEKKPMSDYIQTSASCDGTYSRKMVDRLCSEIKASNLSRGIR